jgi:hypothetical protein
MIGCTCTTCWSAITALRASSLLVKEAFMESEALEGAVSMSADRKNEGLPRIPASRKPNTGKQADHKKRWSAPQEETDGQ